MIHEAITIIMLIVSIMTAGPSQEKPDNAISEPPRRETAQYGTRIYGPPVTRGDDLTRPLPD